MILERCLRCKEGQLTVISAGDYANTVLVHCQNAECDVIYEVELSER
jgi:hypothetical protein